MAITEIAETLALLNGAAGVAPAPGPVCARRFAPHQLRHAHAVEVAREGVPLMVIQRQLGHCDLAITSVSLLGLDNSEIIDTIHARSAPVIPASAGLKL